MKKRLDVILSMYLSFNQLYRFVSIISWMNLVRKASIHTWIAWIWVSTNLCRSSFKGMMSVAHNLHLNPLTTQLSYNLPLVHTNWSTQVFGLSRETWSGCRWNHQTSAAVSAMWSPEADWGKKKTIKLSILHRSHSINAIVLKSNKLLFYQKCCVKNTLMVHFASVWGKGHIT